MLNTANVTDVDHDPRKVARDARKARVATNEKQRLGNVARAQSSTNPREERKMDISKTLATTRISTASMGKFDKKLEGEKKLRGVKRKVCIVVMTATCVLTLFLSLSLRKPRSKMKRRYL